MLIEKIRKNPLHFVCLVIALGISVLVLRSFIARGVNEERQMREAFAMTAVNELVSSIAENSEEEQKIHSERAAELKRVKQIFFKNLKVQSILNSDFDTNNFLAFMETILSEEDRTDYLAIKEQLYDTYAKN